MKKLFALLAVALGVVACQKDQADFGVNLGGEQEVTINVALSAETRASSALGSLDNDVLKSHDLRYTLEIYQGDHCLRMEKFTTEDNVAFPVRLAPGREYNFAVWADFVKKEGEDAHKDLYYTTSLGLKRITLNKAGAMDEARDAFYGKATLAADANLASLSTITLTRPFAKVRVVATDIEDVRKFGIEPDGATVTYGVALPTEFNAVEGVAYNPQTLSAINYAIDNKAYSDAAGQLTVFADYIFVPESGTISFNLDVKDGGVRIKENNFSTAIPVAVNKVTSIVGDVLTDSKNLDININDKFDAETIYLEGDVTLTEDLKVNRPLVVAAGKTAVLNLNGKKIINTNPSENYGEGEGIVVYGNLTIEGEGTIQGTSMAVWARGNNNAVVTIKGGTFVGCGADLEGGRSVVYASSGNVVNIYGGEFKAEAADETSFAATQYPVLNVADNNGMINVYGGRFYKQNPAAPGTEPAAWNANHPNGFLAEGCVAEADGDWFKVKYDPYYYHTKVSTADEFKAELEKGTSKIFLNSGNYEGTFHIKVANVNIAGADDAKIIGRVHINSVNASFKNVMFDRNETNSNEPNNTASNALQYKAVVMIYGDQTNTIKFDGCKFYNNNGTHKSAITNVACDLIVDNCYFEGRSSSIYSQANLSVTNSTFNYSGTNNVILSINGCGDNGGKVIFKNNTITNKIFVLSQFLSTVGFGNGTYHFDIQGNTADKFDYYWANTSRVTNKTFATGSLDFSAPSL